MLQLLTILNISDNHLKVILTYFNCTITITGLTIFFVFKYMTKYQMYELMDDPYDSDQERLDTNQSSDDP